MELDIFDFIEQCRHLAEQALGKHAGEPASGGSARWIHVVLHCFRVEETHSYREAPNRLQYMAEPRHALELDPDEIPDHTTITTPSRISHSNGSATGPRRHPVEDRTRV